jgi:phosphopantothenate synthetase
VTEDRIDRNDAARRQGTDMNEQHEDFQTGDIVEFTLNGERRTAEVMLVTTDDVVLLDLFDGDRPAWARRATLEDVAIFRPDLSDALVAA